MYWADKVAREIIESGEYKPYWVDDMFTPSGYAHIGSLRGPIVHDLVHKALIHSGQDSTFTFVINDFDPIDGLPSDMQDDFSKYLGVPLRKSPSPKPGFETFADYFADDYLKNLKALGVEPKVFSSWDMYHEGKFDEAIRIALDNAEKIQDIYQEVAGSKKKELGWLPLQVICQNCGKIGTTRVFGWNGETVAYRCELEMVKWAKGCGFEGRISPFGGNGKLPWKVDWPAHWMVMGVTIEGSGKDHSSRGGSRDIASELCKKVFKILEPYNLPYEFFLIGGKKMASSKGLGLKARELSDILPQEVGRFLFCRSDFKQQVNFDPMGTMAIPDLFDEYDRCFKAYTDSSDETLARTFEMSQIGELPKKESTFLPRFRDVVNYLQQGGYLQKKFEEIKGSDLNEEELHNLREREKYAGIWLEKYAPEEFRFQFTDSVPDKAKELTGEQKRYLKEAISLVEQGLVSEDLQTKLYELSKAQGLKPKDAFSAIYIALLGKEYGPKAGWLLSSYPVDKVVQRLEEVSS